MIRRPDPDAERGLRLFGAVLTRVSGRTTEDWFIEIGLVQTGTFLGRDHDTLGLVISEQQLSSPVLESLEMARIAAGGNANIAPRELTLELTYGIQLGTHVRVSPNLQLILNPDQQAEPFRTRDIPNAWVIGLKFTIEVMQKS